MKIRIMLSLFVITGFGLTGCHNKQVANSNENSGPATAYTPDMPNDSSVVKPAVDPSAVEGINVAKYPNGVIKAKGYCSNGKREGEWQSFYQDGKMWSDEYYTNGYPDGAVSVWYNNGQLMYKGQYRNGKPVGKWQCWNRDGKLNRVADYDKKGTNTAM